MLTTASTHQKMLSSRAIIAEKIGYRPERAGNTALAHRASMNNANDIAGHKTHGLVGRQHRKEPSRYEGQIAALKIRQRLNLQIMEAKTRRDHPHFFRFTHPGTRRARARSISI